MGNRGGEKQKLNETPGDGALIKRERDNKIPTDKIYNIL